MKISTVLLALLLSTTLLGQGHKSFEFEGPAILIHGGAGWILPENMGEEREALVEASLTSIVERGYELLDSGAHGMDVVVNILSLLENDSLFNAGKGAVVNSKGTAELDASVMDGQTLKAGAVAGVTTVKNPSILARRVMDSTSHVLLIADGAEEFATEQGVQRVENSYFLTARRNAQYARWKAQQKMGTVGVVVLDSAGNVYAGTSTGGMMYKKYGRVGDVPVIGAGTYADANGAAVSCTGHGEYFIRNSVAFQINARIMFGGCTLAGAMHAVLFEVLNQDAGSGGAIAIDKDGHATWSFNSPGMFRAACGVLKGEDEPQTTVGMYKEPTDAYNEASGCSTPQTQN